MNSKVIFCLQLAVAILIPVLIAVGNGFITTKNIKPWYESLQKPSFSPPNWLFAPVWFYLYITMGIASFLVYCSANGFNGLAGIALALYTVQLVLNAIWPALFFGFHLLLWSFVEIVVLDVFTAATGLVFSRVNAIAGFLFLPYLAWLTFATILNYSVYSLNPYEGLDPADQYCEKESCGLW